MLSWANQFDVCCFFDNHNYPCSHNSYECLLATGIDKQLNTLAGDSFDQLKLFSRAEKDWIF
jgi:para-aminobenzoate synthetase component 1